MTHRSATALLLALPIGLGTVGCEDDACRPDGTCVRSDHRCDFDNICKPTCSVDDECGPDGYCVDGVGLCRAGPDPDADAGVPDSGTMCSGVAGTEACACFDNGTCEFGLKCSEELCVAANGEEDQPCFPNRTCGSDTLDCVGASPLPEVCRPIASGGLGEPCFDNALEPRAPRCRSLEAACEEAETDVFVCKGGTFDACQQQDDCREGWGCEDGMCRRGRGRCDRRMDCEVGQFCCGEDGTIFAADDVCPVGVFKGDCFDAPVATYAVACSGHADCAPTPPESPKPSGISQCEPERGFLCSAPCEPNAPDPGCPNGWACGSGYLGCFEDADCGVEGLTCVDADRLLGRQGRCRCVGPGGALLTCTSTLAMDERPTATSREERAGEAFSVDDDRCEPPLPDATSG